MIDWLRASRAEQSTVCLESAPPLREVGGRLVTSPARLWSRKLVLRECAVLVSHCKTRASPCGRARVAMYSTGHAALCGTISDFRCRPIHLFLENTLPPFILLNSLFLSLFGFSTYSIFLLSIFSFLNSKEKRSRSSLARGFLKSFEVLKVLS